MIQRHDIKNLLRKFYFIGHKRKLMPGELGNLLCGIRYDEVLILWKYNRNAFTCWMLPARRHPTRHST